MDDEIVLSGVVGEAVELHQLRGGESMSSWHGVDREEVGAEEFPYEAGDECEVSNLER